MVDLTYDVLVAIAYRYLDDKSLIYDIAQTAYKNILCYIHAFNEKKDGYAWLYTIVKREALKTNEKVEFVPYNDEEHAALDREFEKLIAKDEVKSYIKLYGKEDRQLLYLRFWKSLTLEQIAAKKGLTTSCVFKRIKKIVKEILEKVNNNENKT